MHVYLQTREDGDIEPPVEDHDPRDEEEEERDEWDREDREDAEDGRDGYSYYSGTEGGVAYEGEGAEDQRVSVSPSTWSPRGGVTVQAPGKDGQGYD
eukprot:54406-Eustigmatos_ZCMA.PRE.1